ncbi:hypothetical protein P3T22_006388 [Paraburkholderia sp. GAS348]
MPTTPRFPLTVKIHLYGTLRVYVIYSNRNAPQCSLWTTDWHVANHRFIRVAKWRLVARQQTFANQLRRTAPGRVVPDSYPS